MYDVCGIVPQRILKGASCADPLGFRLILICGWSRFPYPGFGPFRTTGMG